MALTAPGMRLPLAAKHPIPRLTRPPQDGGNLIVHQQMFRIRCHARAMTGMGLRLSGLVREDVLVVGRAAGSSGVMGQAA